MKFCTECESVMTKNTTAIGQIVYTCRCQLVEEGKPDDTLMAEGYLESARNDSKHMVFIENAPFDNAGHIVLKDCPQCGLNFLTMIRVGLTETTIFTCSCGYRATNDEYMRAFEKRENKKEKSAKAAEPVEK